MKIQKKELVNALTTAAKFCGKGAMATSAPITGTVLIDGKGQCVVASNLSAVAIVSTNITDYTQRIEGEKPEVVHPDEAFLADLKSLKKGQLEMLCEDYGIEASGTIAQLAEAIYAASEEGARQEEEKPAPVAEVVERFCVDPKKLLGIVKTLEMKDDDAVEITVEAFEQKSEILTDVSANSISVGGHFKALPVRPAKHFPEIPEYRTVLATDIPGKDLMAASELTLRLGPNDKGWKEMILFDPERNNMVSTDGKRLYVVNRELGNANKMLLSGCDLHAIGSIAKDKSVRMNVSATIDEPTGWVCMEYGKLKVHIRADSGNNFPDYVALVGKEPTHSVVVENAKLSNVFQQAAAVADKDAPCAVFKFNDGIDIEKYGASGNYERENVPFVKGKIEGDPIQIGLNVAFLMQTLKHLDEKVSIDLTDDDNPVFFHSEKSNLRALIMPVRL